MTKRDGHAPSHRGSALLRLMLLAAAVVLATLVHLGLGSSHIPMTQALEALMHPDPAEFAHHVIRTLRLPRTAGAALTGAALGLAGALIQALTRNPLGEPQLLGLNAGAAFAVVACTSFSVPWLSSPAVLPFTAAAGGAALFALVLSFAQAGRNGMTILKLTFCGIAMSAFASALTSGLLILDEDSLQELRAWLAGDLAQAGIAPAVHALPAALAGAFLTLALSSRLGAMALGDSAARSLGIHVGQTRILGLAAAALLCGAAVSVAGPLGFIGLVGPHIARLLLHRPFGAQLAGAALIGALLVLLADVVARTAFAPRELATGVLTAFVGAPAFMYLVLRKRR